MVWPFRVATKFLVSRLGLDIVGRPCVITWNRYRDKACPLGIATQLLVSRSARRAACVATGHAHLALYMRLQGARRARQHLPVCVVCTQCTRTVHTTHLLQCIVLCTVWVLCVNIVHRVSKIFNLVQWDPKKKKYKKKKNYV